MLYFSWQILRPLGSIVLPFEIKKKASLALPALRIESLLQNIVSIGINYMSLEMLWPSWGEKRKCSAIVVGLDLVLALPKVRRCSLKRSFKCRLVSLMYCRWYQ